MAVALPQPPLRPKFAPREARALPDLRRHVAGNDYELMRESCERARAALAGGTLWSVNSTAIGGGVAEMLRSFIPYMRGAAIDARWAVIAGTPEFFTTTKRLHNMLHGYTGDGGGLGARERAVYEDVLAANAPGLRSVLNPRDVLVLHDPQTAGLLPLLADTGATMVWRCHVGVGQPAELTNAAWRFLLPYLERADRIVASPGALLPPALAGMPTDRIAPAIDPCTPKNLPMPEANARAILHQAGIADFGHVSAPPVFRRRDGSLGRVRTRASVRRLGEVAVADRPLIVHLGRWDRLKDPAGVLEAIVEHVPERLGAHLVLAGPDAAAVADDPEGGAVLAEVERTWTQLSPQDRGRVTLATLPMVDLDENEATVNALQRVATVVVKKSLQEGFGLGVTEALWKRRPVVAASVGGVREQIMHRISGVLVEDPRDLSAFGRAVGEVLETPGWGGALGQNGHLVVRRRYLSTRHITDWCELLATRRHALRVSSAS
jgi:trehalose synthase